MLRLVLQTAQAWNRTPEQFKACSDFDQAQMLALTKAMQATCSNGHPLAKATDSSVRIRGDHFSCGFCEAAEKEEHALRKANKNNPEAMFGVKFFAYERADDDTDDQAEEATPDD